MTDTKRPEITNQQEESMQSVQRQFKVTAITDRGAPLKKVALEQVAPEPDWPAEFVVYTDMAVQPGEELTLTLARSND